MQIFRAGAHQWLVKKDIVHMIPFVLFLGYNQAEQAEVVEVPKLLSVCHWEVTSRSADLVNDLINKLVRVLKWQLAYLLQNAFA